MISRNEGGRTRGRLRTVTAVKMCFALLVATVGAFAGASVASAASGDNDERLILILCPPVAPGVPQNLRQPDTTVVLKWDEVPCATGYNVHDENGGFIKSVSRPRFHPAQPGKSYFVTAYSSVGISDRSEVFKVAARNCPNSKPDAPRNLTRWSSSKSLRWGFMPCVDGYNIHNAADGSYVTSVACNCFTKAVPGEKYFVTAYRNGKISDRSNVFQN